MKDKIIQAATQMFLKFGFKSVTMDDIAENMAISKKTIYKNFDQKESLILDCIENARQDVNQLILDLRQKDLNPIEENYAVRRHFMTLIKATDSSPLYQLKKHYPQIYDSLLDRDRMDCDHFVRSNIERGIQSGHYRKEIDIDNIISFYYILFFHLGSHSETKEGIFEKEMDALEYHIRAIATPKGIEELEKQLIIPN